MHSLGIFACLVTTSLVALPAFADFKVQQEHIFPKPKFAPQPKVATKAPVVLSADQVDYDQKNAIVTASGHVEIAQGDTIILADKVVYDQNKNLARAIGHVSMLEPSGNVYFADEVRLKDDMKSGVVTQLKARLPDNSRFVAAGGRKIDDTHTELFKLAYTPCDCDLHGKPKTPTWQIKADYAMVDQEEHQVRYNDATFDFYGVPILYTPYFSHPTPDAANQSGLLTPTFMQSTNLGAQLRLPIYYAIAPDRDLTFTPIYTSKAGGVAAGEYRQMFDAGPLLLSGSVTSAPNTDGLGNQTAGHQMRGHIDARGTFQIDDHFDWGFNIRRASDDTYLHLYDFSNDTLLTSKIYAEGFNFIDDNDRTFVSVKGLSFQGLTGQDNTKVIPVIAPLTDFNYQSNPGLYNSRFLLDGNLMSLYRQSGDESRRASGTVGWKLPYITADGQAIEFTAKLRSDVYDVTDVMLPGGRNFSGVTGREMPQVSILWHYPLINRFSPTSSLMIEPVVEMDASSSGGNSLKIPNEDTQVPEFNDANLFSPDRFAGYDLVENGGGASFGMRGQAQLYTDKYIDWVLGQHYRFYDDDAFPFSSDPKDRFSDYVGKISLTSQPFTVAYRFRIDHDTWAATRNEIDATLNEYPLTITTSYLSLRNDPVLADKRTITGSASLNLNRQWSWNVTGSEDLLLHQVDTAYTGLTYKNECANITTMIGKDYTNLLDIKPSTTFWFRVSLKNLD